MTLNQIQEIQKNNWTFEDFENYYLNDFIPNDLSFVEYEQDIIFDYIDIIMDILQYESSEEFENFDLIFEYLRDKLRFKYNLKELLKNSNINLD